MFWKNNYAVSPQIEQLLEKEDITLSELMDEEDILQECKAQNKKLIDFLLRPNVLEQLVTLITTEPSSDVEESSRYRHSNTACEILTCDLPALNERLSSDTTLLQTLYAFIEQEPPLNPLLCSFFSKTLAMLITRHSEQNWYSYQVSCLQVVEFLKSRPECVSTLLRHVATPAIMDLLFKLISQVEGNEMRSSVISWLDSQKIVPTLVSLLKPEHGPDIHCNVSQLLCDIVRADREARLEYADIDCILTALESPETVALVLDYILVQPRMESSIVGGIQFLLTLLDQSVRTGPPYASDNGNKDEPLHNAQQQEIVVALLPYLKDFHDVLVNPPFKHPIRTTVGLLEVPVGNARLQIARFISTLLGYNENLRCCEAIADIGIIETLLDLFFKYSWNNFLHGYVEKCVTSILQCVGAEVTCLQKRLFNEGKIIQKMLEGWNNNVSQQSQEKGTRGGYMGHIIKILNNIEAISSEPLKDYITSVLAENPPTEEAWSSFLTGPLKDVNKTQSAWLGGVHPVQCKPDEINEDFKEIPFPATSIHHSQMGDMPPEFSGSFGNFDEDNLDADLESNLDAFMNILGMGSNYRDANDWQMSGDNSNDLGLKSSDDPWSNEISTLVSANPWTNVSEDNQEQGWADFSSDNFADFDTNFCKLSNASICIPENNDSDIVENNIDGTDDNALNTSGTSSDDNVLPPTEKMNEVKIDDSKESLVMDGTHEICTEKIVENSVESVEDGKSEENEVLQQESNSQEAKPEVLVSEIEPVEVKPEPRPEKTEPEPEPKQAETTETVTVEMLPLKSCSESVEVNSVDVVNSLSASPTVITQNAEDLQIKCEYGIQN